ncbi:TetR/AcrR family transcriptional regulator [Cytobacillus sp. Hz8]|uniref:TetR/AcrR family transcriptional regulator n=1 Tax=Cytobacillus sp. Hz8 TaxID=3347168 RepID=UPI0035DA7724
MKNKGNQKSDQSKAWMEEALLKLMETEVYENITIQEITDNAGLSRRTFYRNYASKDEIIEGVFLRIWKEYETNVKKNHDFSLPSIAKTLFSVMVKHLDFLIVINRHHLLPMCLSKVDELLPPTFDEVKGSTMSFSKESISYALTFSTGGFMRLMIKWLNEGHEKSPDEISTIIEDIVSIINYSNVTA